MASEKIGLALSHNHLLFQNDSNSGFRSGPDRSAAGTSGNNNCKATRELTGFIEHRNRFYQPERTAEFQQRMYNPGPAHQTWQGGNERGSDSPTRDGSDGNDDDDVDADVEGFVESREDKNKNNSTAKKDGNVKSNHISSFGNDVNDARPSTSANHQQDASQFQNDVARVDRDSELYYSHYLHGAEGSGSGSGFKDTAVENGCGFSGRKDVSYSGESGDSLRTILSDPLTGTLMDDAMILPCGHSFGGGGMQHVMKMKACYTCSHPVTEGLMASNLSLRSAVMAFRREEELQVPHASKRRRERLEQMQDRTNYNDSMFMDTPRGKGLHFPFSVADRVIIKGNKRTPERFVGCEAVVTTQCLNGWYVVKTLDNAESIKVQYRSLAKVS